MVNTVKIYLFVSFYFFFCKVSFAQGYTEINNYLIQQKSQYQAVLSSVTDEEILGLNEIIVFDDEVVIEIKLNIGQDRAISVWNSIQISFKKSNPIEFHEWLLIKMSATFDLPLDDISIRIYNDASEDEIPNLDGFISYNAAANRIESRFESRSVVKGNFKIGETKINEKFKYLPQVGIESESESEILERVYKHIAENAKAYFARSEEVRFTIQDVGNILIIDVVNIQGEVVAMDDGVFASISNPYEKLKIIINLNLDSINNSITCAVDIDGKYGSGMWLLRPSKEENYIEMFPKYKKELEDYLEMKFNPRLKEWLDN